MRKKKLSLLALVLLMALVAADDSCESTIHVQECSEEERQQASSFSDWLFSISDAYEDYRKQTLASFDDGQGRISRRLRKRDLTRFLLKEWLKAVDLDPTKYVHNKADSNWIHLLHQRTMERAPGIFFKLWNATHPPTPCEVELALLLDPNVSRRDGKDDCMVGIGDKENFERLLGQLFVPFRHRGYILAVADDFCRLFAGSLKSASFAIPSPEAIRWLAGNAIPLIEVGAGRGYWGALIQNQVEELHNNDGQTAVQLFDAHAAVPVERMEENPDSSFYYFDEEPFMQVHESSCLDLIHTSTYSVVNHTLMLIWPNNPDQEDVDSPFYEPGLPPVWDYACVRAFVQAGGSRVALVGERQANLPPGSTSSQSLWRDWGLSATRTLQDYVATNFTLLHRMDIPTWFYRDDLTVWTLNS